MMMRMVRIVVTTVIGVVLEVERFSFKVELQIYSLVCDSSYPVLATPILPLALILIISVICAIQIVIDLRYHILIIEFFEIGIQNYTLC